MLAGVGERDGVTRTKVVESILENKEEHDLGDDRCPAREGHLPGCHAKEFCHGVEKPDLRHATYMRIRTER